MNYLLSIAQILSDAGIASTGESLFINMMPISVSNGVLLRNPINGTKIDYEINGHYNTEFKVIVRTTNYQTGADMMTAIFEALTLTNETLEDISIKQCYPDNEPISYPISEGNILELATDFKIAFGIINDG